MQVEVPAEWSDVDGAPYTDEDGNAITDVRASSSLDEFHTLWTTPGMIFSASSDWAASTTEEALLDEFVTSAEGQCDYAGRSEYSDPAYTGSYDIFTNCGDALATYVVVAAQPADGSSIILVQVQANEERDFDALDRILASFFVIGEV
jgi:serine protease Do